MELLFGLIVVCIFVVYMAIRQQNQGARERYTRDLKQSAATQAWIHECTTNYRQMEMICGPVPLGLDLDELVVFVLPGVDLLESRAIRKSRSYYGGPTIRLAKVCHCALALAPARARATRSCATSTTAHWY